MTPELYDRLAPLTDWIPPDIRAMTRVEVWWAIELVVALLFLLVVGRILRAVLRSLARALFHRAEVWDAGLGVALMPGPLESPPTLLLYQRPAWVRLVVLAPVGKRPIDPADVGALLRNLGPNLERQAIA